MGFTEIKADYELLKRRRLSNGTVGDLLERMERKGIVVKKQGRYYAGLEDEKLILEVIDVKRVRAGRRGATQSLQAPSTRQISIDVEREEAVPQVVRRFFREVEKLVEQGHTGRALGLLQHTLISVRETGRWLLWVKDIFIYWERKAKPPHHYFRSERLARILEGMGLRQGFIHTQPVHDLVHHVPGRIS